MTMPRQSLRKSGRISATYSSEVKPAPASSTAIRAPRAIHGRSRSWMRADVLHGVLLGELDDQARGQALGELGETGVTERVGGDVDKQQAAVRRLAGAGHRGPAGDLEVVAQAAAGSGGEGDVGRQGDQAGRRREAGEALVADRLEIAEADDRLEDGTDRAGLE